MNTPHRNRRFVVFLWCSIVLTSISSVAQAQQSQVTSSGNAVQARKVDEYGNIRFDDEKERLNIFAGQLQLEPTAKGYIIGYGSCAGEAELRAYRAKDYLVDDRGIDASRVIIIDGGCRVELVIQLWVVPSGASPPEPSTEASVSPCPECRRRRRRRATRNGHEPSRPSIPDFPWPPPRASARTILPGSLLQTPSGQTVLYDVAARLQQAFNDAGYGDLSWYGVEEGFAMVSRMEQFSTDGTPLPDPDRFSSEIAQPRTLGERLREVFSARQGHFRVVVFIVTSKPILQSTRRLSREEAIEIIAAGADRIPDEIGRQAFSNLHQCTALIYEFEQPTPDHNAQFVPSSRLDAIVHLRRGGIIPALERRR